jgi:hypothetical protein
MGPNGGDRSIEGFAISREPPILRCAHGPFEGGLGPEPTWSAFSNEGTAKAGVSVTLPRPRP